SWRCLAATTTPIPPRPSTCSTWYFPAIVSPVLTGADIGECTLLRRRSPPVQPPRPDVIDALDRRVRRERVIHRTTASDEEPVEEGSVLANVEDLRAPLPARDRHRGGDDRAGLVRRAVEDRRAPEDREVEAQPSSFVGLHVRGQVDEGRGRSRRASVVEDQVEELRRLRDLGFDRGEVFGRAIER